MTTIEESFQGAINNKKINGAVFNARNKNGTFTYNEALGTRTLLTGESKPQTQNDMLYLASATKLITTIAALQCVEDGLLSLDSDLTPICPALGSKKVLKGFTDDENRSPILEPVNQPITLRMLLSHSSGVTYHFLDPAIGAWRERFGNANANANASDEDEKRTVEELFNYPLSFQPGEGWMYGPGLDWAGRIIELVTGRTLCERMQERIFTPLGISDVSFYPVTRDELRGRLVDLNPDDVEGLGRAVLGGGGDMNRWSKGDFGGHGLFMTGCDFVKVLGSLLDEDGVLLKSQTVDGMFLQQLGAEASKSHLEKLAGPAGPFFRVGVDLETKVGYGLSGLLTLEDVDGWYGEGTLSWGGGLTLAWFIDRKNGLCGVGAVQSALPVDGELVAELKQVFRRDIYRKLAEWEQRM
jgi:CubicO group peptidase (beta-lactamase class C family)